MHQWLRWRPKDRTCTALSSHRGERKANHTSIIKKIIVGVGGLGVIGTAGFLGYVEVNCDKIWDVPLPNSLA